MRPLTDYVGKLHNVPDLPSRPLPRALLFDIDGTLTDTEAVHFAAWTRILAPLGRRLDHDFYMANFFGLTSEAIVARNFADMAPGDAARLPDAKEALFRDLLATIAPRDGLLALIARARRDGCRLAAVTNAPRANAELILGRLGLGSAFDALVVGDELTRPKPDPLPYLTALARLGVVAGDARVYEDSPVGVRSAVGAAVETVAVDPGAVDLGPSHPLRRIGAARVIHDFGGE
jgi:HAD superfamily hydrolase (TIGR01509 family)